MTLNTLKNAILEACLNLWHYTAPNNAQVPYAVWAEDQRFDFEANGKHAEHAWQGTLDYFTRTENDLEVQNIEEALDSIPIGWRLNSIQYEEDTGVIHYEWVWNLYGTNDLE
ncbi:MAG: hypothetical protein IJ091_11370 [Oscillospiraceae bacterium]|nr:hypothetical protein [Oscillospiraceae bacterium]MBQ8996399.1 hypothetical protein [Oscillospiraceae bacterium]